MSKYFTYFPKVSYLNKSVTDITRRVKINENLLVDPYAFLPYTVSGEDRPEDVAYYYYGDQNKVWLVYLANNIIDPYTQWPLSNSNLDKTLDKKYYKPALAFAATDVVSSTIAINAHGFSTTDPVNFSILTGSSISGLVNGSTYYVIRVNDNEIKLASSAANAIANTPITLTATSGTYSIQRDTLIWLQSTSITSNIVMYRNIEDPTVSITADTYRLDNTLITSEWQAIRVYDYETELNEAKRSIFLINTAYANKVEEDLKVVLNND